MTELYLQCLILSLLEEAKVKIRQNFPRNFIPQNSKKHWKGPGENTAEENSFEWYHCKISSTDKKVRTTR